VANECTLPQRLKQAAKKILSCGRNSPRRLKPQ
jgi:hypothetical protein